MRSVCIPPNTILRVLTVVKQPPRHGPMCDLKSPSRKPGHNDCIRLPQLPTLSPKTAGGGRAMSHAVPLPKNSTTQACLSNAPSALALTSSRRTNRFFAQGPRKMHVFMKKGGRNRCNLASFFCGGAFRCRGVSKKGPATIPPNPRFKIIIRGKMDCGGGIEL